MFNERNFVNLFFPYLCRRASIWSWWKGETIVDGLKLAYKRKLLPVEERHRFHDFNNCRLNDADFDAKPIVLLMGQYSTGKTTFIKYLLGSDFPGIRIGPEPTTDRFIAVMHDQKARIIPGNSLVYDQSKPFGPLASYGNAFLSKFQCSTLKNQVLEAISIIDTPGILSGEKQRVDRGYDFTGVVHWFAERVDKIILLFDAHKLDISDEFKRSIEALNGHYDKILILLNKADMVDHQSLMRIYGSLMWSLEKVFRTPEVPKVFVGSFWEKSIKNTINRQLFEDEEHDLFKNIQDLPRTAALRKLNDLAKRARSVRVHAHITHALREKMPSLFMREQTKKSLIDSLGNLFLEIHKETNLPLGDFPDVATTQEQLRHYDFDKFQSIDHYQMRLVDEMLEKDIVQIMALIPAEEMTSDMIFKVGALSTMSDGHSPFSYKVDLGFNAGKMESGWIVEKHREKYDKLFNELGPDETGRLNRAVAKNYFLKTQLPNIVLSKVYLLADIDDDGLLDKDEFALANYVIALLLEGFDLPDTMPKHLIPPSKRRGVSRGND